MRMLFDHEAAFLDYILAQCRASAPASPAPEPGVTNMLNQILKELSKMSDNLAKIMDEQTKLQDDVAAQTTVIASATTAFQSLAKQLADAEAAAKAAGATDAQVAGFTAVRTSLESNTSALAAAIPANTPAADPAPAAATPPADPAAPATPAAADPAVPAASDLQSVSAEHAPPA